MRCDIPQFYVPSSGTHLQIKYDPVFNFHSEQCKIDLEMTDSYKARNDILSALHTHANNWLGLALARAPIELQATLQVSSPSV